MPTGAIYSTKTGLISQTISPPLSNPDQLAGLAANGLSQIIIEDGKTGASGMVDISTGQYVDFLPPGPPVPNILIQLSAALINKGLISSSDFHPTTISEINTSLEPVNMATVSVAK